MKKFLFLLTGLMFMLASCGGGEDEILDSPDNPNTPNNPTPAPKPDDLNTVTLTTAGTLKNTLGENYLDISTLKIVGPINGNDVYYLREMMGGGENESVRANLSYLDLSEAKIVEGGNWYVIDYNYSSKKHYTSNNEIGDFMFSGCSILRSIVLPNNANSIGNFAFLNCESLTSVTIPNSVTSIGKIAFSGCSAVTSVYISDLNAWCNIDFDDQYANPLKGGTKLYLNNEEVSELVIPNDVKEIKAYAFRGCEIISVTIPNSVTSIGESAFAHCESLTSVTIPNSVTSIGESAFLNCESLTSVTIPNSVTSIGESAFYSCESLTSVTISNSVTSIGESAFAYCKSLTSVTIPNSVTSIEREAFYSCEALTSVTIPNSVTSIEYRAFAYCKSLTSVTIPNSVTLIRSETFKFCEALTSVTIPNSVTSIEYRAFYDCYALAEVYCYAINPPFIDNNSFFEYSNKFLYVPEGSGSVYKLSSWSYYFRNIVEMEE